VSFFNRRRSRDLHAWNRCSRYRSRGDLHAGILWLPSIVSATNQFARVTERWRGAPAGLINRDWTWLGFTEAMVLLSNFWSLRLFYNLIDLTRDSLIKNLDTSCSFVCRIVFNKSARKKDIHFSFSFSFYCISFFYLSLSFSQKLLKHRSNQNFLESLMRGSLDSTLDWVMRIMNVHGICKKKFVKNKSYKIMAVN